MTAAAMFDENEHATTEGWATYQSRPMRRFRLRCAVGRHRLPTPPVVRNGHSPSNYSQCSRCRGFLKWFVVAQHRRGGLDRVRSDA